MNKKKINKEMISKIKNYGNQIKSITKFVDIVRQTPARYIGATGNTGYKNMFREIFQNSMDELMKKNSPCDRIKVSFDDRTLTAIVEDNGRGIPFDKIIKIFTDDKTSSNYEKVKGEYSSGTHGTGSTIANALCEYFKVESFILGEAREVVFKDFEPETKKPVVIKNVGNKQGTRITFIPSMDVMGTINVTHKELISAVKALLPVSDVGSVIEFNYIDMEGNKGRQILKNTDGILSIIIRETKTPLMNPISIQGDDGETKVDILFTYDIDEMSGESIISYSNMTHTAQGGIHEEGFLMGIKKYFKDYMNNIYLKTARNKLIATNNDVTAGLKAVVNISVLHPQFGGQSKDILREAIDKPGVQTRLIGPYLRDYVYDALVDWGNKNPKDLNKVCKYFKDIINLRLKNEKNKININKQYKASSITGMPAKYEKPSDMSRDDLEFIVFEGDSAAGGARLNRSSNQGLLPLRGKIINAFGAPKSKVLKNEEVASIIKILGAGYGKSFDINKCKFKKVIFMTDADSDGAHIAVLLLSFFILYMPDLIKHGRLYKAVPPLYGVPKAKGKGLQYFTNKREFFIYLQKSFSSKNVIANYNKTVLSKNDIIELLYKNDEYVYEVKTIADRYAVDPHMLELIILNRDKDFKFIKKLITKKYRFMNVEKKNNNILISGLIDQKYQYIVLGDTLINDAANIVHYIDKVNGKIIKYYINGKLQTLYDIMQAFEKETPKGLKRFKGLGEMSGRQLGESTLTPEGNRTLIRYTFDDAKEEIAMIRHLESNKAKLIENIGRVSRSELI